MQGAMVRGRWQRWLAVGAIVCPPAIASNEVHALCIVPTLLFVPIGIVLYALAFAVVIAVPLLGYAVGRRLGKPLAGLPGWLLAITLGGGLLLAAADAVRQQSTKPATRKPAAACELTMDLRPPFLVLPWLPLLLIAGLARGIQRGRHGDPPAAGQGSAQNPSTQRSTQGAVDSRSGDGPREDRARTTPAQSPPGYLSSELAAGLLPRAPERVAPEPVTADQRARIAAAASRLQTRRTGVPPPLPWQREGAAAAGPRGDQDMPKPPSDERAATP